MSKDWYDYESTPGVTLHAVDGESRSLEVKEVSLAATSVLACIIWPPYSKMRTPASRNPSRNWR